MKWVTALGSPRSNPAGELQSLERNGGVVVSKGTDLFTTQIMTFAKCCLYVPHPSRGSGWLGHTGAAARLPHARARGTSIAWIVVGNYKYVQGVISLIYPVTTSTVPEIGTGVGRIPNDSVRRPERGYNEAQDIHRGGYRGTTSIPCKGTLGPKEWE